MVMKLTTGAFALCAKRLGEIDPIDGECFFSAAEIIIQSQKIVKKT